MGGGRNMPRRVSPVRLGFAPTRRNVFSAEDSVRYRKLTEEKLKAWGVQYVGLDWLNEEALLYDPMDSAKVARRFREEGVDALFCPHCNFGTEDAVCKLAADLRKPLLLWGPRDEAPLPSGERLRDTQCGLFATSKVLRRFGVPFTYIVNSRVDDPVFERGVKNFLRAAAAVRAFHSLRIGQIDVRPQAFWTVMVNEGELLERFGIEVVPKSLVEIVDAVKGKLEAGGKAMQETVQEIKSRVKLPAGADSWVPTLAALKLVLLEWADVEGLSAIAIQCWNALQAALHVMPCFVDGEVTNEGVPVACETDIHGAITAAMLHAAGLGETPTFFADLTIRNPENDNSELLWHCGNFPAALKAEGEQAALVEHYILETREPGLGEFQVRGGDITLARFDGDGGEYSLLMGHARSTTGPRTRGTFLWVEVNDWPKWEEHIIRGPYIHHIVGIHGRLAPALYEACRFIPGLVADPVEPTEDEIRAWLRGA
jgi:L-fucose isomerase-like protein